MKLSRVQRMLLVLAAALLAALAATFRRVPRPKKEAAPEAATAPGPAGVGQPTTLLSGFDYSETAAGKTRFSVHADRTVGFAQGAGLPSTWYRLERVALTLYSQTGSPLAVAADAADYDPRSKAMNLRGDVVARDAAGTEVRAADVRFDPDRRRLAIPGEVRFSRGAVAGSASAAVYDTDARVLTLAGPIVATGTGSGAPFDRMSADAGEYRGGDGSMTLAGRVQAARARDTLSCDRLSLHLAAENRVDAATARGNVRGTVASGDALPSYTADEAVSTIDASGNPARVVLTGVPATVTEPAGPGQPARTLAASSIDLRFAGERLVAADAAGRPRLGRTVPGKSGAPFDESITSDTSRGSFAADGSLAEARFEGHVVGVTVNGTSRSPAASYSARTDATTLFGRGGEDAELEAERGRIVARRIDIDGKEGTITATDQARAFLRPGPGTGAPAFLASSKQPTRAKALRIVFDDRSRVARLSGDAALWQEENSLLADEIELRDSDRTARAAGHVRVSARAAAGAAAKTPERSRVTSTAMRYDDVARTAFFEGNVVAVRGSQRAAGDRAECLFDPDHRIERTILDGGVTFEDRATSRRGSGTRVVDEPSRGVTNLAGDPAVAQDAQGNRVQGAILTFRKESGSVEVKAKEGGRIESIYQTHGR